MHLILSALFYTYHDFKLGLVISTELSLILFKIHEIFSEVDCEGNMREVKRASTGY